MATLLQEIDRLRPHYQTGSALDAGRRQLLDHFEVMARTGRLMVDAPPTDREAALKEALAEVIDGTPAHHLAELCAPMTIERAREIRALAGLDPNG